MTTGDNATILQQTERLRGSAPAGSVRSPFNGPSKATWMANLQEADQPFGDVLVRAEGRVFSAHRAILVSVSDYFAALFSEDRFVDGSEPLVSLPEMSADAFEKFLKWAYLGEFDETESMTLLAVSSRLRCENLFDKVERSLTERINPSTCLELWEAAEAMGPVELNELAKASEKKALKTFEKVAASEHFERLSANRLSHLLSSDELVVSSEKVVLSSAIAWAKAQPEPLDEERLEKVFSQVRFIMMPEAFLEETVEKEQLKGRPSIMTPLLRSYGKKFEWVMRPRRACIKHWGDRSIQHWGYGTERMR